jgi:hypothetical protein
MATTSAPTVADIPNLDSQIGSLQQQEGNYQSNLNNSPTAFSGAAPTSGDISNQTSLSKIQTSIQALQNQKLSAQWYPPAQKTSDPNGDPGSGGTNFIGEALDYLGRPVRGIVGAVQHFTGQGTDSLLNDVASNMTTGNEYFGDVLSKAGAPSWVSAPLGIALDIALDPVNWATMGEAALVPKIAGGLIRGGVDGAAIAAKAGVLEKAATVGKYVPGFGTYFGDGSQAFTTLGQKTLAATNDYESLTGNTADALVQQRGMGYGNTRIPLSTVISKVADAVPGGQKVLSTLVYDPVNWVKQTVQMDIIKRAFGSAGIVDLNGALKAQSEGKSIDEFMKPAQQTIESMPFQPAEDLSSASTPADIISQKEVDTALAALPPEIGARLAAAAPDMTSKVDDIAEINKNPDVGVTGDALTNGLRILNEGSGGSPMTLEDVAAVMNSGVMGETGVQWFDNMMQGIKDFRATVDANGQRIGGIGETTLNYYDKMMGLFRGAKVGGSPTGHLNSIFGNAIMNHLGIGDIGPDYFLRYKQAFDLYGNVPGSAAKLQGQLMDAGVWGQQVISDLKQMPTAVMGTFGEMPSFLDADTTARMLMQNIVSEAGKVSGMNTAGMTAEQLAPYVDEGMKDLESFRASLPADVDRGVMGGTSIVRKMKGDISKMDVPTDMVSQELFDKPAAREMFDYIAEKAKADPKNPFWWAMDTVYNKMTNQYSKWDQISKMATFLRSTVDGYTLPQLIKARHLIDINPEDLSVLEKDGIKRYRLNARKGVELTNALYMNYAAMPSAMRVLRNMPIVGSPFASFMYGMALKTGQAIAYNPAAFNKVGFAMNELGGTPTPLEKQALTSPIYSYLKQPGMYRVPFTDANPLYINLSNVIPYYSMNMFNPSQQNYDTSSIGNSFAQFIDASPFVKDPLGSILFNNIVQPAILSEGTQPQGQFGQNIWPADADFLTKLGYTTRDLTESVVPGVGAFAGLAGGLAAPGLTNYVPLYRYRNLANAVQGKNVYGIAGKEPVASRTARGILSAVGVPVQAPVNLTFAPNSTNN